MSSVGSPLKRIWVPSEGGLDRMLHLGETIQLDCMIRAGIRQYRRRTRREKPSTYFS